MSGGAEPQRAASLNSGLLARRGDAQPAMRRQSVGSLASITPRNEDLGWNDMGPDHDPQHDEAPVTQAPPAVSLPARRGGSPIARQIDAIAERLADSRPIVPDMQGAAPVVPQEQPALPAEASRPQPARSKTAFTLRLDAPRHLRLRLLTALSQRSAQQLLVAALDRMLADEDQIEPLARQVEADRDRGGSKP